MSITTKKSVLIVSPEPPYPARLNGISIRYAPIIESLSSEIDIDVAVILRHGVRFNELPLLQKHCRATYCFERKPNNVTKFQKGLLRLRKYIPIGTPYVCYCHDHHEIKIFLESIAKNKRYDRIIWISPTYLDIGIDVFGGENVVLDSIDSAYSHFSRKQTRKFLDFLDCIHLKRWELQSIAKTRSTIFVSQLDASLYSDSPAAATKIHVIPNGVYLTDSESTTTQAALPPFNNQNPIRLGVLGNMGYQPNIDAAIRLKRLYDKVRRTRPNTCLLIIGRSPVKEVTALADTDGVVVTGTVENIWPYINAVDIFVFPMVSGAGQQNKMLEAMIAGKPVIANALANSGVGGEKNKHLLTCESDNQFVEAITRLIDDHEYRVALGSAGRAFIQRTYDWTSLIPKFRTILFS